MPIPPPRLDDRTPEKAVQQILREADKAFSAAPNIPRWALAGKWTDGEMKEILSPPFRDPGIMLAFAFARLLEMILERLNRVPEKNFLAFLEALGVNLLPPAPARVPLTFALTSGSPPTLVPRGTQASTEPSKGSPALIFETEDDFTALPCRLVRAFTMDPGWDRFTDQTGPLAGQSAAGFPPLVGAQRLPHIFHLGDSALLDFKEAAVDVCLPEGAAAPWIKELRMLFGQLKWFSLRNGEAFPIEPMVLPPRFSPKETEIPAGAIDLELKETAGLVAGDTLAVGDKKNYEWVLIQGVEGDVVHLASPLRRAYPGDVLVGLARPPVVRFLHLFLPEAMTVQGVSVSPVVRQGFQNRWIWGELASPFPDAPLAQKLSVSRLRLNAKASGLLPDAAFGQAAAVDVTKDFLPFGPTPKSGDAFYVGSQEAFSKPEAKVTLWAEVKPAAPPLLAWESPGSEGLASWTPLAVEDATSGLTQDGTLSVPSSAIAARVRIVSGGYCGVPWVRLFRARESMLKERVRAGDQEADFSPPLNLKEKSVLFIGDELVMVKEVMENGAVSLMTPFAEDHETGEPVERRGLSADPVGALADRAERGDSFVVVQASLPEFVESGFALEIKPQLVGEPPEFIRVKRVVPVSREDKTYRIETLDPLCFGHAAGRTVEAVTTRFMGMTKAGLTDFSRPFYPFGKRPFPGDFFAWRILPEFGFLPTHFKASGLPREATGQYTIVVEIDPAGPDLAWDFLSADGWRPFPSSRGKSPSVLDETGGFTKSGRVSLLLPPNEPGEIFGKRSRWIRARLTGDDYGVSSEFLPSDPEETKAVFRVKPGTGNLNPPVIRRLTIAYEAETDPAILCRDGFFYRDQTEENRNGEPYLPFMSPAKLSPGIYADRTPALYLAFDSAFPGQPLTLYVSAAPRSFAGRIGPEKKKSSAVSDSLASIRWEYFAGTAWKALPVSDDTEGLTQSGVVEFLTPPDMAPLAKFDLQESFWVRALGLREEPARIGLPGDDPLRTPCLQGVYLNTLPAAQAVTVEWEILGSSNGLAGQTFRFSRTPVVPGQQVWVREPGGLPGKGVQGEGEGAEERKNPVTGETEVWTEWQEVPHLLSSESFHRHYTMDPVNGMIGFGDGNRGMIPPPGTHNLAAAYRAGGGAAGNVSSGAVKQLKTPLAGIASVLNPVAADGGADAETVPEVEERGPETLRHRQRGITGEDLEWLARQAAGKRVARAKCLPNVNAELRSEPGWATLLILPRGDQPRLSPSSELIREVEKYLEDRTPAGLARSVPVRLNVMGPGYIRVAVVASIVPEDWDEAEPVRKRAVAAIDRFLHPLTGGPEGRGWVFGRDAYGSEVCRILEEVEGVDHVAELGLVPWMAQHRLSLSTPLEIEGGLPEGCRICSRDGVKASLLARGIPPGRSPGAVVIKGFMEGDRITRVLDMRVNEVDAGQIEVVGMDGISPVRAEGPGFPSGSRVMNFDGTDQTILTGGIEPGSRQVGVIGVQDPKFTAALRPGDWITVLYPFPMRVTSVDVHNTGQVLGVQPYPTELPLPQGCVVATIDNRVRSPLTAEVPTAPGRTPITSLTLGSFGEGDPVTIFRPDGSSLPGNLEIAALEAVSDTVFLDDHFLVYPGEHLISMIAG